MSTSVLLNAMYHTLSSPSIIVSHVFISIPFHSNSLSHPCASSSQDRPGGQGLPRMCRVLPEVHRKLCQGSYPFDGTPKEGDEVHLDGSSAGSFRRTKEGSDYSPHSFSAGLGVGVPRHLGRSGWCLGAILWQYQEDRKEGPIYYASQQMNSAERNYTSTEREALAVVYACRKFRHYLLGYRVVFHTDHNSL
jgi:hypothetical protein